MNREAEIANRIAEMKGTIDCYSNADGGSYTLRKLFGTMSAADVLPEATRLMAQLKRDVQGAAESFTQNPVTVVTGIPEISGFSQGGYFQIAVSLRGLGTYGYELLAVLQKLGYRIKR